MFSQRAVCTHIFHARSYLDFGENDSWLGLRVVFAGPPWLQCLKHETRSIHRKLMHTRRWRSTRIINTTSCLAALSTSRASRAFQGASVQRKLARRQSFVTKVKIHHSRRCKSFDVLDDGRPSCQVVMVFRSCSQGNRINHMHSFHCTAIAAGVQFAFRQLQSG